MGFFELAHLLTGFDRLQKFCAYMTLEHMRSLITHSLYTQETFKSAAF